MTDLQTIPRNRLVHAKSNVRKTGRDLGIEGVMISINTYGLRQNFNVRPTSGNRFEAVAGGRRLEAMRRLAKAGQLDASTPVPCQLVSEEDMTNAVDFKTTTNTILVGEPAGASPNNWPEVRSFTLPNSGLRVGVSTRYNEFLPGEAEAPA